MNAAPKTLRQLSELFAAGLAAPERRAALERVAAQYAVAITPPLAELIDRNDPNDPIARQFVSDAAELDTQPHESADPIGDHAHAPSPGIVHRYPDRALLKLTATCAVYCRFCFRREMVGPGVESLTPQQIDAALGYLAAHPDIWEVILTGGWAFAAALGFMLGAFGQIPITDFMIGKLASGPSRARIYAVRYVVAFTVLAASLPLIAFVYTNYGFDTLFRIMAGAATVIFIATACLPSRLPAPAPATA